jgi:PAS domain S-box-containing protein
MNQSPLDRRLRWRAFLDRRARHDARYQTLVEQLPVVVYHYTEGLPFDYVSPNVEKVLGHPAADYMADSRLWHRTIHPDDRERMEGAWHRGREEGTGYEVECRYVRPDGRIVVVRDNARVMFDTTGLVASWQGVLVDITAQKRAELEREISQRRYRALVEQVPAIVYEMGPDDERRTLFVSSHVEELLGYSQQEWLDQPDIWVELLHPEDREIELAAHDLHNQTGEPWGREYRLIASDGSVVWVSDNAVLVPDAERGDATWHGVMLDISERKELEERLKLMNDELEHRVRERTTELGEANEMMGLEIGERRRIENELRSARERYRRLVEDLPAVAYLWELTADGEGRGYTSPRVKDLLGFTPEEWSEPGFWKTRVHPHDLAFVDAMDERSRTTGEPFNAEYRYLAKDGHAVWVVDRATMLERDGGRPALFQGVLLDISDRKEAERKAQEAQTWYMRLSEESPGIVWVVSGRDEDPTIRWQHYYVNAREPDLLGYELDDFAGPSLWRNHLHPDDRARVIQENEHAWRTGEPWNTDLRMLAKDGSVLWFQLQSRTVEFDSRGLPEVYQGVMLNIDERKREQEEVQATLMRQQSVLDGLPALVWTAVTDLEKGTSHISYVGRQSLDLLGWSPEELESGDSSQHIARLVHPDDRAMVADAYQRAIIEDTPLDLTCRIVIRDGSIRNIRSIARRVSPPDVMPQIWQGLSVLRDPPIAATDAGEAPTAKGSSQALVNPGA